jgi:hypothetical protein
VVGITGWLTNTIKSLISRRNELQCTDNISMFSACTVREGVVLVPCLASPPLHWRKSVGAPVAYTIARETKRFGPIRLQSQRHKLLKFISPVTEYFFFPCICPCSSFLFTPQFFCLSRFCFTVAVPTSARTKPELLFHGVCQV